MIIIVNIKYIFIIILFRKDNEVLLAHYFSLG